MNESDDEKFLDIFQMNNLEEVMSDFAVDLTVKDLQNGLAAITNVAAFVSQFLVDFFSVIEENKPDEAPKLSQESILHLVNLFENADCFLELIDVEYDEDENEDESDEN